MLTNPSASHVSFFLLFRIYNLGNNTKNARKGLAISKLPVAYMHVLTRPPSFSHHHQLQTRVSWILWAAQDLQIGFAGDPRFLFEFLEVDPSRTGRLPGNHICGYAQKQYLLKVGGLFRRNLNFFMCLTQGPDIQKVMEPILTSQTQILMY